MELSKLFQNIAPVLVSIPYQCEVEMQDGDAREKTYHITYRLSRKNESDALLIQFNITLDIPVLIDKLKSNHSLIIDEDTILTYVKLKNHEIIPYLKLYNGQYTNYDEIAKAFYNSRGLVLMDWFGV